MPSLGLRRPRPEVEGHRGHRAFFSQVRTLTENKVQPFVSRFSLFMAADYRRAPTEWQAHRRHQSSPLSRVAGQKADAYP